LGALSRHVVAVFSDGTRALSHRLHGSAKPGGTGGFEHADVADGSGQAGQGAVRTDRADQWRELAAVDSASR
jgi:hypothetical protein